MLYNVVVVSATLCSVSLEADERRLRGAKQLVEAGHCSMRHGVRGDLLLLPRKLCSGGPRGHRETLGSVTEDTPV